MKLLNYIQPSQPLTTRRTRQDSMNKPILTLEGARVTPLAGGRVFTQAAWKTGVTPRHSISYNRFQPQHLPGPTLRAQSLPPPPASSTGPLRQALPRQSTCPFSRRQTDRAGTVLVLNPKSRREY